MHGDAAPNHPLIQKLQLEQARSEYFLPATQTAAAFHLQTERGLALAFDIHVQNGGIHKAAWREILSRSGSITGEPALRILIANAVADAAKPEFQDDVRARKLAIATGLGAVHREMIASVNWGLAEYPYCLS